jgi:putative flippase GtrA
MKIPKSPSEAKELGLSMSKFAATSLLGTGLDFLSFTFIFRLILPLFWAEIGAALIGMIVNFFMQKKFVFQLNRKVQAAFILSIAVSFILMFAGAFALTSLVKIEPFTTFPLIAKVTVMGMKFVFNFFSKRWIFEK